MNVELVVVEDAEEAARRTAELLAAAARRGGQIALSGGSTPRRAYDWPPSWRETGVGSTPGSGTSAASPRTTTAPTSASCARRSSHGPRCRRVRPVETERPPAEAAAACDGALEGVVLDLALNGLGPDGHTASLFPDAPSLAVRDARAVAAEAGLEPWVDQVTLTVPMLSAAEQVVFLAVGADKAEAARRAFADPPSPSTPASLVRSTRGRTVAILDRAAARLIVSGSAGA